MMNDCALKDQTLVLLSPAGLKAAAMRAVGCSLPLTAVDASGRLS